jgi:PAS domain S-box-containing protein
MEEFERVRPSRVVIDSLSEIRLLAQGSLRYWRQILALKHHFAGRGATVLLLDDLTSEESDRTVHSIVHGVLHLEELAPNYGAERRRLRVFKYRGRAYRGGWHDFAIKPGGVQAFPRLVAAEHRAGVERGVLSTGLASFDALLGGGVETGSSALIIGPVGTGKSTVALQFVEAAVRRGEKAASFVFDEEPGLLFDRTRAIGFDLEAMRDAGALHIEQIDAAELSPGEFAHRVRARVDEAQAKTVLIDSVNGYHAAMPEEKSLILHMHELLQYLNRQSVTTFLTRSRSSTSKAFCAGCRLSSPSRPGIRNRALRRRDVRDPHQRGVDPRPHRARRRDRAHAARRGGHRGARLRRAGSCVRQLGGDTTFLVIADIGPAPGRCPRTGGMDRGAAELVRPARPRAHRHGVTEQTPRAAQLAEALGDVTLLERPFHRTTFVSLARSAARSRHRQYEARARMEALRESEERLQVALDAGKLGAWELDIDANELTCSANCRAVFGRSPDARFAYADLVAAVHPDDLDRMQVAVRQSVERGSDCAIEFRTFWPDGSEHWAEVRARRVADPGGGSGRLVGVSSDITARKTGEERLRQLNESLEERVAKRSFSPMLPGTSSSSPAAGRTPVLKIFLYRNTDS